MKQKGPPRLPYYIIGALSMMLALAAGWTRLAVQIDNYHYDWTLKLYPPVKPAQDAVVLAIDDLTYRKYTQRHMRRAMALGLERLTHAQPKAVAIDLILSEKSEDAEDQELAAAMKKISKVVLSADLVPGSGDWEEPYGLFAPAAAAVGHVHAEPDTYDGVSRYIPLWKAAHGTRHWALALEAARMATNAGPIGESPSEVTIGKLSIPIRAPRNPEKMRLMYVRYRPRGIEHVSLQDLIEKPGAAERLRNKVVFLGVTSQSMARDRLVTPNSAGTPMTGVEIHAHVYEAVAQQDYLRQARDYLVLLTCILLTLMTATGFALVNNWQSYAIAAVQIAIAHALPHFLFPRGIFFPLMAPAACAWLTGICCSAYLYFVVRKQLNRSEADRTRYQQAIHFVSHEMKSPLTAIQGSSELMSRYNLSEEKRKQIAGMINSESKRLARMIQTFLDVERLGEGQMDLKREPFCMQDVVIVCVERARPLAERKKIDLHVGELSPDDVSGDRELMEYAVYNLLSNAVKYSPQETKVDVATRTVNGQLMVSVSDQGIGMDDRELKKIGTRFYRTERAEKSGETGTGIGLSIVSQIVQHHGGKLDVSSVPGKGSCFTIVVPVLVAK
ncbi:MAG: CHASE2 domain-containing protein [Acidobacteria bacterium]|nr:CHASE2 domain-containing protein [Acidobacteriota bacterium]